MPLSGGGLISGIAAALKALKPDVNVIGVSMERGAAMNASLDAGKPVLVEELPTLADSLGGGIGLDNRFTFAMCAICWTMWCCCRRKKSPKASAMPMGRNARSSKARGGRDRGPAGRQGPVGGPVVALLSGGNIDMEQHRSIISGEDVDANGAHGLNRMTILTEADLRSVSGSTSMPLPASKTLSRAGDAAGGDAADPQADFPSIMARLT